MNVFDGGGLNQCILHLHHPKNKINSLRFLHFSQN
jgi:hypothetical protein